MPTLIEAIEEKYGNCSCELENQSVIIFVPKRPPRAIVPELLVLNDCNIDRAGEAEDLKKRVFPVKELDLAQNKLEHWKEVFEILSHMPRIEFVNLSLNRLLGPVNPPTELGATHLRSLVLNNTRLEWESVESLLNCLPALEELHLSMNNFKNVLLDTDEDFLLYDNINNELINEENTNVEKKNNEDEIFFANSSNQKIGRYYKKIQPHNVVHTLHFTGNPVEYWSEICRLGRIFPNLKSLLLAECQIRAIEEIQKPRVAVKESTKQSGNCDKLPPHHFFENLEFLNLSSTNINSWDDIDRLGKFPALKKLRVQNWPLWDKCESTEHERRQLLIARLPMISILNGGGVIGTEEREGSERAFIRYYMDKPESDRPARYNELIAVYGKLDPLVNVNLRPDKRVKVTVIYDENREVRSLDVYQTVSNLKTILEQFVGIPASDMRLYFVDTEALDVMGYEIMKFPNKQLYSYNIRSGDEIIVESKSKTKPRILQREIKIV